MRAISQLREGVGQSQNSRNTGRIVIRSVVDKVALTFFRKLANVIQMSADDNGLLSECRILSSQHADHIFHRRCDRFSSRRGDRHITVQLCIGGDEYHRARDQKLRRQAQWFFLQSLSNLGKAACVRSPDQNGGRTFGCNGSNSSSPCHQHHVRVFDRLGRQRKLVDDDDFPAHIIQPFIVRHHSGQRNSILTCEQDSPRRNWAARNGNLRKARRNQVLSQLGNLIVAGIRSESFQTGTSKSCRHVSRRDVQFSGRCITPGHLIGSQECHSRKHLRLFHAIHRLLLILGQRRYHRLVCTECKKNAG